MFRFKQLFMLSGGLLLVHLAFSQSAWLTPANPSPTDTVTLTFDQSKGSKGLAEWDGTVYLHTGAITGKSIDGGDWKHVTGNWGEDDEQVKMTSIGNGLHQFTFVINDYYQLRAEEVVQQLAYVFRNQDGSKIGKNAQNEDILIPVNGYLPPVTQKAKYFFETRKYVSHELNNNVLTITTSEGQVQVIPYTRRIIEVKHFEGQVQKNDSSHAVIMSPSGHLLEVPSKGEQLVFTTDSLQIIANRNPFYLEFIFRENTLLTEKNGYFRRTDNNGLKFSIDKNEKLYGLGERAIDFDLVGRKYNLYNRPKYGYELPARNLNYSIPLVVSSKKYLLYFDNPQKGYADLGESEKGTLEWGAIGGLMKYFVIAGHNHYSLMQQWANLTGKQPLPPRWALGNLQSRMAYRTQEETDSIVSLMQEKNFPVDAVIIDFYWFGDSILGHLGRLDWFKPSWPDPVKMVDDFKKRGVKTILITEPYIIDTMDNFKVADDLGILATDTLGNTYVNKGFYFGPGALIDIFQPAAGQWFWKQYQKQIGNGIAGWWGDLGEPENHPSDQVHVTGMADEVHNIYAHYWNKMLFENYRKHYPAKRLFNLNRAGFAGSQRFSIYPWTGDVSRSWGGYKAQLPTMLHMSMCGLPFIHSDAGGFAQGTKDDELYTRWVQFSCFTPILRPHGSVVPSEPVYFSEQTQDIVRKFMNLRYSLLPYIYTTATVANIRGYPIVRPMFFDYPDDTTAYSIANQYMFGPSMMVAPVLEAGQSKIDIYFPEGVWYDFWNDKSVEDGGWKSIQSNISTMPLFVREGSFIPMVPPVKSTEYYSSDTLTIRYYNSKTGDTNTYNIFEDDGKTFGTIGRGEFELIKLIAIHLDEKTTQITLIKDGWEYNGMPGTRRITYEVVGYNADDKITVTLNNQKIKSKKKDDSPFYSMNSAGRLTIEFTWDGATTDIVIQKK